MMSDYKKYPRTFHLPYSQCMTADDKRLESDEHFKAFGSVVVTIKMDGENATVYPDGYLHARSIDGSKHEWQNWLKQSTRSWCFDIPIGWRICGENLYPRHSIAYKFARESQYFQVFGIYDSKDFCISWKETKEMCELLGIEHVPEVYCGPYDEDLILKEFNAYKDAAKAQGQEVEGFVVRNAESFPYSEFRKNVGKYVRANHVQTDEHWTQHWTKNEVMKQN